jgi:glycosyltransferase involved in cell wall biosynthesis
MQLEFDTAPRPGLVSVVIPCYNASHFLVETLESALAQTYTHTEIIVIDDGSTDGTAELIRTYAGKVKAEFGPNRGVSAARNRGTILAAGEFIQYLDADDLLVADAIERRVAALQSAEADVAYSDWEKLVEDPQGDFERGECVTKRIEELDANPEVAHLKFWAPPAALTYRRSIVDKIGGWKEWLPIIQDARFIQDAALAGGRFVHVPGVGAQYRVHGGASLSRRGEAAFVSDVFRNTCDLQAAVEARGVMNAEMRVTFAELYNYTARTLFFHDRAAFRDSVARLYALEPGFGLTWPKVAGLASTVFGFKVAGVLLRMLTAVRRVQVDAMTFSRLRP